jgi:hypothetical protein
MHLERKKGKIIFMSMDDYKAVSGILKLLCTRSQGSSYVTPATSIK